MSKRYNSLARKLASALGGLALLVASETADAAQPVKPIIIDTSWDIQKINDTIAAKENEGKTFEWAPGTYPKLGQYEKYTFKGDRNYVFQDGVIIESNSTEGGVIYKVTGSNVNITGIGTVTMNSPFIGIFGDDITNNPITNVHVSGIQSDASDTHYEWKNIRHITDRISPDITFSNMVLNGGVMGFNFQTLGRDVDKKTPYLSIENTTAKNILGTSQDGKLTAIPKRANDVPGQPRVLLDMQGHIKNNVLINTSEITAPEYYSLFNSPINIAQDLNVTNPLVTGGGIYHDSDGDHPYNFDGENCFVTSDMQFIPGTYVPQHNSPLNLGEGKYIGAYVPEGVAKVKNTSFSVIPDYGSHDKLRTVDFQTNFNGKISLLNTGNTEHPQKTDIKYKVEYCIDSDNDNKPNTSDTVLASARYHLTFLNSSDVTDMTSPAFPSSLASQISITVGGKWDIEAIIKDWTSGVLQASNIDSLQVKTISPPDLYSLELLVPAGEWHIYARIINEASDDLNLKIEADLDKYLDYVQFASFESDRVTVTGAPEPATLGLLAAGLGLAAMKRREKKEKDKFGARSNPYNL